ncbi:MAG: hypothetical protein HUK24_00760 [Sphaerochaetaceae bacterium]|nr:hypothetical protein [Sphaerochaetaceae bacterium]
MNLEGYYTQREARTFLHTKQLTLDKYKKKGQLPFIRVKGKIYFKKEDLLPLYEQRKETIKRLEVMRERRARTQEE